MQYELNQDVMMWLDSVRGSMSRQKYITMILRQQMQTESANSIQSTKENSNVKEITHTPQ